ncbi:MAG: hypothetical protein IKI72_02595 [Bacteroidales bacterium]|nr:hypothetical protein [Bacteroidales bacterium]
MKMKKTLLLFGLVCIVAYSCSLDTTRSDALGVGQGFSQQGWQQVINNGKDSVIAQHLRVYTRKNITKDGSHPFSYDIDMTRVDLMDVYGFPIYTIDTALWASQPDLSLDQYLHLDETMAGFYITWQGRPINRVAERYQDGAWIPAPIGIGTGLGYQAPLPEGAWALEAIEKEYQIIGVNVPYHGGLICVCVFKDGKWVRIDSGMRHDPDDVVQDLRKGFNGYILRKPNQARQTDNRPRDLR